MQTCVCLPSLGFPAFLLCLPADNRVHAQEKGVVVVQSGFGGSVHSLVLLRKKEVQDELKLDGGQKAKLEKIAGTQRPIADPTERRKKFAELGKAAERILSAAQLKRFKEISLQADEVSSITDSVVAKALGITSDQLEKLRTVQSKFGERLRALSTGERVRRFEDMQTEAMSQAMTVLTPSQREKYKEMRGAPFKFNTCRK